MVVIFLDVMHSNMSIISNQKHVILEFILIFIFIDRGLRYSIFLMLFFFIYFLSLYFPMESFNKKLAIHTTMNWIIRFRIKKFHKMSIFTLKKIINLNETCIKRFYTYSIVIHSFVNCTVLSGLIINDYENLLQRLLISILICEFFISTITFHLCIRLSSCLTKPVANVFKLINRYKHGPKIDSERYDLLTDSLFYEKIHTKRPFRFQLGFSKISQRSFMTACLFYSSQLLFFIKALKENRRT